MPDLTVPILTQVAEYSGQEAVKISCTQLGTSYSAGQGRQVVASWIEFFTAGPNPIRDLEFVSRTPNRLFEALATQTQLTRLAVKWGDYQDLTVLRDLAQLRELILRGASSVATVDPLGELTNLESLEMESLRKAHDMSALGRLTRLRNLELGGDWIAPRLAHVDSIAFLRYLTNLEDLLLHTLIVDDLDYTPLLALPRLRSVRVRKAQGMTPTHEHLKSVLPWSG